MYNIRTTSLVGPLLTRRIPRRPYISHQPSAPNSPATTQSKRVDITRPWPRPSSPNGQRPSAGTPTTLTFGLSSPGRCLAYLLGRTPSCRAIPAGSALACLYFVPSSCFLHTRPAGGPGIIRSQRARRTGDGSIAELPIGRDRGSPGNPRVVQCRLEKTNEKKKKGLVTVLSVFPTAWLDV